jgi:hypothetical protein
MTPSCKRPIGAEPLRASLWITLSSWKPSAFFRKWTSYGSSVRATSTCELMYLNKKSSPSHILLWKLLHTQRILFLESHSHSLSPRSFWSAPKKQDSGRIKLIIRRVSFNSTSGWFSWFRSVPLVSWRRPKGLQALGTTENVGVHVVYEMKTTWFVRIYRLHIQ